MPASLRFHLDESVTTEVALGLRRRDRDCSTTQEQSLLGVPDTDQLAFAVHEGRVLITADRDFLRIASQNSDHCGIVFWRREHHFGQLVRQLDELCFAHTPDEVRGRVLFLS